MDTDYFRELLLRTVHDLRSPLRGIRTSAEMLLALPEKRTGSDLEQLLGFIMENSRKIDSLVGGLSALSIALGTQPDSFVPTRVDVVLRSVLAKLAEPIRDAGAHVEYGEMPKISADPERLAQVFENLLRNAIENRGPTPPMVGIRAEQREGDWLFAVQDNGTGIEAGYLERIFRPFERLRRDAAGPGLGLAICREIVSRHGGKIWAESKAESGTTIYFTHPRT